MEAPVSRIPFGQWNIWRASRRCLDLISRGGVRGPFSRASAPQGFLRRARIILSRISARDGAAPPLAVAPHSQQGVAGRQSRQIPVLFAMAGHPSVCLTRRPGIRKSVGAAGTPGQGLFAVTSCRVRGGCARRTVRKSPESEPVRWEQAVRKTLSLRTGEMRPHAASSARLCTIAAERVRHGGRRYSGAVGILLRAPLHAGHLVPGLAQCQRSGSQLGWRLAGTTKQAPRYRTRWVPDQCPPQVGSGWQDQRFSGRGLAGEIERSSFVTTVAEIAAGLGLLTTHGERFAGRRSGVRWHLPSHALDGRSPLRCGLVRLCRG